MPYTDHETGTVWPDRSIMTEATRVSINEREILSVVCPTCKRDTGKTCVMGVDRIPLAYQVGDNNLSFHIERIRAAAKAQATRMGFDESWMAPNDKFLILCYSLIMVCDSVAANSKAVLGREMTSEDIQRWFASKAIEELIQDGLMKCPPNRSTPKILEGTKANTHNK